MGSSYRARLRAVLPRKLCLGHGQAQKYSAMQGNGEAGRSLVAGVPQEDLAGGGVLGPWQHGCLRGGRHAQDRAGSRVRFGRWTAGPGT